MKFCSRKVCTYIGTHINTFISDGNPDFDNKEQDLKFLKEKVDAGADFIITQIFYDADTFVEWREECRKIGTIIVVNSSKSYLFNFVHFL